MDVTGGDLAPSGGNTDLRFIEIFVVKTDGMHHRTTRCAIRTIKYLGGEWAARIRHALLLMDQHENVNRQVAVCGEKSGIFTFPKKLIEKKRQ